MPEGTTTVAQLPVIMRSRLLSGASVTDLAAEALEYAERAEHQRVRLAAHHESAATLYALYLTRQRALQDLALSTPARSAADVAVHAGLGLDIVDRALVGKDLPEEAIEALTQVRRLFASAVRVLHRDALEAGIDVTPSIDPDALDQYEIEFGGDA